MPTLTQTFDFPPYEIANKLPLLKDKPCLVNQRRRSAISLNELPPSPADSETDATMPPPLPLTKEELRITRPIGRGAPGDEAIFSSSKTPEQKELAKRKSQYYGDVFAAREPISSARERIYRESMIMADIRTNVIIQDEYTFITDLSSFLSSRYQRPESSIIVTVTHSACLLFSGSFDPAYTMGITALQSQLQPVTNRRNTALIQKHMEESLGPGPERGLIKFSAIAEENFATNGKTITGQMDELEKEVTEDNASLRRSLSRSTPKTKRRHSIKSLRNMKISSPLPTHAEMMTPPMSDFEIPPLPAVPTEKSSLDRKAEKVQKVGRRKSFITSMFGRGG